jgi:hypothetical protein
MIHERKAILKVVQYLIAVTVILGMLYAGVVNFERDHTVSFLVLMCVALLTMYVVSEFIHYQGLRRIFLDQFLKEDRRNYTTAKRDLILLFGYKAILSIASFVAVIGVNALSSALERTILMSGIVIVIGGNMIGAFLGLAYTMNTLKVLLLYPSIEALDSVDSHIASMLFDLVLILRREVPILQTTAKEMARSLEIIGVPSGRIYYANASAVTIKELVSHRIGKDTTAHKLYKYSNSWDLALEPVNTRQLVMALLARAGEIKSREDVTEVDQWLTCIMTLSLIPFPNKKFFLDPDNKLVEPDAPVEIDVEDDNDVRIPVGTCKVCMGKGIEVVLGCGHACLCDGCARLLVEQKQTCPICRAKIEKVSKVYIC